MNSYATQSHAFDLPGGPIGVLLIHGLTGTPAEMRVLARGLHRCGYTVHCMQIAGHCGTAADLVGTSWTQWRESVSQAAMRLQQHSDIFFIGGLSMGAVLSLDYAAHHPSRVAGVLALAPVFKHDGWAMPWHTQLGACLLPFFKRFNLASNGFARELPPYGIKDAAIRRRIVGKMLAGESAQAGLAGTPWYALAEMYGLVADLRRNLHKVAAPCLVIHSDHDDVAGPGNAWLIWQKVLRAPVQLVWLRDSYHMVTVDRERRKVIHASLTFLQDVVAMRNRQMDDGAIPLDR